jgi:hypothetical protein
VCAAAEFQYRPFGGGLEEVEKIVPQIRKKCPQVEIILGGDGGFCREALMSWCEEHAVGYIFGLAKNQRLSKIIGRQLREAQLEFQAGQQPARVFTEFSYQIRDDIEPTAAMEAAVKVP